MKRGFSIIEIMIAMAIGAIVISGAVISSGGFGAALGGSQSVVSDSEINAEALRKAQDVIEQAAAISRTNYHSVIPSSVVEYSGGLPYTKTLSIPTAYQTQCSQAIVGTVSWTGTYGRNLRAGATTTIVNIPEMLALGGDCAVAQPSGGWKPPALFARDTISPGKINVLDALNKIVYLGSEDTAPFLFIASTTYAVFNNSSNQPLIIGGNIPYSNSFNASGKVIDKINDIDAFRDSASGKTYVFVAMASSTAQLGVIDVTDIYNPKLVAKRKLKNVTANNATAWGWRLYYANGVLYITSRETAGPEFHAFDVASLLTNPQNPYPPDPSANEIGSGAQLTGGVGTNGTTVEDFVVRDGIAYFAAKKDTKELLVYDVSNPASIQHISGASRDLPGIEDGRSLFLVGNKLYFGRDSSSVGPEFYIFDTSNTRTVVGGLRIFGVSDPNKEMNKDITDLRIAGRFAFLASYGDSSGGFDVWDISDPTNIQSIDLTFNFGNKLRAIDYENDFVYAASETTPNFQLLYSP